MKSNHDKSKMTRREFCGMTAGGLLGAAGAGSAFARGHEAHARAAAAAAPTQTSITTVQEAAKQRTRVAMVRDPAIWLDGGLKTDLAVVRKMLDRTVCLALDGDDPTACWKSLFKPDDVVGIKVNCLGGRTIATRPDLAQAVVDSLLEAGVPPGNIIVWERSDKELTRSGYTVQKEPGQVRCMAPPTMAERPVMAGPIETRLCSFVADTCTALINLPVMKTHDLAGFTCAMKNMVGAVPNPGKFHPEQCKTVGDLNALPEIQEKTRLTVVDASRPLYDQGPADHPASRYKFDALIAGVDRVAVDRIVQSLLEEKRNAVKGEPWPLQDPPRYMARAAELKLGETNLERIRFVREEKS